MLSAFILAPKMSESNHCTVKYNTGHGGRIEPFSLSFFIFLNSSKEISLSAFMSARSFSRFFIFTCNSDTVCVHKTKNLESFSAKRVKLRQQGVASVKAHSSKCVFCLDQRETFSKVSITLDNILMHLLRNASHNLIVYFSNAS